MSLPAPPPAPDFNSDALNQIVEGEIDTLTTDDPEIARKEVSQLEKSRRDALRREIQEYRLGKQEDGIESEDEKLLEILEKEILTQETNDKEKAGFVVESTVAAEKNLSPMQKMTESIMGPIKGIMKSLIAILPLSMIKNMVEKNPGGMFSRMASDIVKERSIYGKMALIVGADKMIKSPDDDKYIKEITKQYNALPKPAEGKKMTFEEFYTAKMNMVALETPPHSLLDVKIAEIDEQKVQEKSKEVAEEKNDNERDRLKEKEKMDTNPEIKKAVHLYALAKAMNSLTDGISPDIDPEDMKLDLAGRENGGDYAYKNLAGEIATWFNDYSSRAPLGIEINDWGHLEESDGSNWIWDNDLIRNFKENLVNNPRLAFNGLANLNLAEFSLNSTATTQLPLLQTKMREQLSKLSNGAFDVLAENDEA